ncbi:glycoside hydrolase family 134 protein [Aspergillus tanneri]|uniref:Uncharacterized protein n=1 Tax=Aspergillus tanneri TaxID=1220188 RepID=A0A5M9ME30_9EURO|nr:uncharacterized protein ATNIH1004_010494 [Aspergillus tanneri]KAA8643720.1 hypothetical protein ATNIH1004_010494 [Aspergillus tanneri]
MDLAIAMLETETVTTNYTYGKIDFSRHRHNEVKGDGKNGDSTNFGIFKQNWMIPRTPASEFRGQNVGGVDNGGVLNSYLSKDIKARHDGEKHYGFDVWCAGHRNGASGQDNPNTEDINSQ